MRAVYKNDTSEVHFRYDAAGNRIAKITESDMTIYVRDASGNVMGVYKNDTLAEQSIYGSSRLGLVNYASKTGYRSLGGKKYELSNHLGNVLAVVSDNIHLDQDSTWTSLINTTDFYPFGLAMDGRTVQDSSYRYGFNGKELDGGGEWGSKSHYDYGFRIYSPSIGKFLSVDPLAGSFAMLTPFQYGSNNPIYNIDLDGLEGMSYEQKLLHKDDDEWYSTLGKFAYNTLITAGNAVPGTVNLVANPKQGFNEIKDGVSGLLGSISRDVKNPSAMWERGMENISDIGRWEDLTASLGSLYLGGKSNIKISNSKKIINNVTNLKLGPQLSQRVAATFKEGKYINRQLTKNEVFYKYHGVNNRTGKKVSWLTNKLFSSEDDLRSSLAIHRDWKVEINSYTKFEVPTGTWVSEGKAAAQGVGYPGQGYQAVIENLPKSWIKNTNKAFE